MYKPRGPYAKWNKPITIRQMLWFYLYASRVVKLIKKETHIVTASGLGKGTLGGCLIGIEFQFCKVKKLWRLVTQPYDYTLYGQTTHLKWL